MKRILVVLFSLISLCNVNAEDIVWDPTPINIPTFNAGFNASNALIGMDDAGDIVTAWLEVNPTGGNYILYANTMPFGTGYNSLRTEPLSGGGAVTEAVMVVDPNGYATVVWIEGGTVFAKTYNASPSFTGGVWDASPATLDLSGTSSQVQVTLDITAAPVYMVAAVWINDILSVKSVVSSYKISTSSSWNSNTSVSGTTSPAAPQIAQGNGYQVVVYNDLVGISPTSAVFSATKVFSGLFGTGTQISEMGVPSKDPQVTIFPSANGAAIATWFRFEQTGVDYSNVFLQLSQQTQAGSSSWTPGMDVSDQPGVVNPDILFLRMAADFFQNCCVVWTMSYDGDTYAVQSLFKGLQNNSLIDIARQNIFAFTVDLAVDSQSNAVVAYTYNQNSVGMVVRSVDGDLASPEPGWGYAVNLTSSGLDGFARVAIGYDTTQVMEPFISNAAAVWLDSSGPNTQLQLKKGQATLLDPPHNLTVSQMSVSYGAYVDHVNTLMWTQSTSPDLIKYLVYRDEVIVDQFGAGPTAFTYVDHNQPNAGPTGPTGPAITYGVAVIDDQSSQSSIVTITIPPP